MKWNSSSILISAIFLGFTDCDPALSVMIFYRSLIEMDSSLSDYEATDFIMGNCYICSLFRSFVNRKFISSASKSFLSKAKTDLIHFSQRTNLMNSLALSSGGII